MKRNGYILFQGKSAIDGNPIVCIATGFASQSANQKTGAMIQTWIIRSDISPLDALKTGGDVSICGDCPHRPQRLSDTGYHQRSCYVNPVGVQSIYHAFKRGSYPMANAEVFRGHTLRLGSYGDPAALPANLIQDWIANADNHTGYSHQWRGGDMQSQTMASVDNENEYWRANADGYRTFRVRHDNEPLMPWEIDCPAPIRGTKCTDCGLCNGMASNAKNISIIAHGIGANQF